MESSKRDEDSIVLFPLHILTI